MVTRFILRACARRGGALLCAVGSLGGGVVAPRVRRLARSEGMPPGGGILAGVTQFRCCNP